MVRHVAFGDAGDTAEGRLKATDFLVEANHNEWHSLWSRWCAESNECREPIFKKWEQLGGWVVTVGKIYDRPICVDLQWTNLDGFLVCNWDACSELVDFKMVDKWIDDHYDRETLDKRRARCDAANFHFLTHEFEKRKPKCPT